MTEAGRPRIHVYTGTGQGKTMAAFGLALRSLGHGKKVVIVQFMKGRRNIGEYRAAARLGSGLEIRQFGRKELIDLAHPTHEDFRLARQGLEFASGALLGKPDLMVLDELGLAASIGLVGVKEVLDLIGRADPRTVLVITGRKVPKEIVDMADLVTEMHEVRHPMRAGVGPRKGLEY